MSVVLEDHVGCEKLAALFDVDLVVTVDEDVGDFVISKQRFEGTQAEQLVLELLDQPASVCVSQQASVFIKNVVDGGGNLARDLRGLEGLELGDIDSFEQLVVNLDLQAARAIRDSVLAAAHGRADKRAACRGGLWRTSALSDTLEPINQSHLAYLIVFDA